MGTISQYDPVLNEYPPDQSFWNRYNTGANSATENLATQPTASPNPCSNCQPGNHHLGLCKRDATDMRTRPDRTLSLLAALMLVGLVSIGVAPITADHAPGRKHVLGSSKKGIVYWCGHKLTPPFVISKDPGSRSLFVNDLPLKLSPPDSMVGDPGPLFERKGDVMSRAQIVSDSLIQDGATAEVARLAMINIIRSARNVVDSVAIRNDRTIMIYWKDGLEEVSSTPVSGRPLADAQMDSIAVHTITDGLDNGDAVLFGGDGAWIFVSAPYTRDLESQIDSLRVGHKLSHPLPLWGKDPKMKEQIEHPRPMDELKEGDTR